MYIVIVAQVELAQTVLVDGDIDLGEGTAVGIFAAVAYFQSVHSDTQFNTRCTFEYQFSGAGDVGIQIPQHTAVAVEQTTATQLIVQVEFAGICRRTGLVGIGIDPVPLEIHILGNVVVAFGQHQSSDGLCDSGSSLVQTLNGSVGRVQLILCVGNGGSQSLETIVGVDVCLIVLGQSDGLGQIGLRRCQRVAALDEINIVDLDAA